MAIEDLQQQTNAEWWDIKRAASHVGMSVSFIRKAVRLNKIPYARAGAKSLRFRRSDLDRWLEANGSGGEIADPKR